MGIGKTSVCRKLNEMLPNSVFLDGDWCWAMHPFQVTEETKAMVMDNICHLLNGFLRCSAFENIVFCWVMHEQEIIDSLLSRLDLGDYEVRCVSLICEKDVLMKRLESDIQAGLRTADILERSCVRRELYHRLNTIKIDTTSKSIEDTTRELAKL